MYEFENYMMPKIIMREMVEYYALKDWNNLEDLRSQLLSEGQSAFE